MNKLIKLYMERQNLIESVSPKDRYEFESILTHNIRFGTIHLASLINHDRVEDFDNCLKVVLNCIDQFSSPSQLLLDIFNVVNRTGFNVSNAEPICHFLAAQYINLWVYANDIEQLDPKRAFVYLVAELRSTFNREFSNILNFENLSIEDILTTFMETFKNDSNN